MRGIGLPASWHGARRGAIGSDQAGGCPSPEGGAPEPDRLTVLSTFGPLATKTLGVDPARGGTVVLAGYGEAARFRVGFLPARTLRELHAALARLNRRPRSFVVRGEPRLGTDLGSCRRLLHPQRGDNGALIPATFRAAARRWLACDFDSVPTPEGLDWPDDWRSTAAFLVSLLPREFAGCGGVVQATAGAGVKLGIRARLWFLLDRPVTDAAATRWLRASPLDRALYRPVQPHYTAAPMLRGVPDPMRWRVRLVPGARQRVAVPRLPEPERRPPAAPAPREPRREDGSRYALAALAAECDGIAATPAGGGRHGRHAELNRAAFKLARFVRSGELHAAEVVSNLIQAARQAGLADSDDELRRYLRYGLRAGLERAGVR